MRYKTLLILVLSLTQIQAFAQETKSLCFDGKCFNYSESTQIATDAKSVYESLSANIEGNLKPYVYFSQEMVEHSTSDLYKSFHKYFYWITKGSLSYIVEGDAYSAVLLNKSDSDRYALYFNNKIRKFEISHETPEEFEAIERLWINSAIKPQELN